MGRSVTFLHVIRREESDSRGFGLEMPFEPVGIDYKG